MRKTKSKIGIKYTKELKTKVVQSIIKGEFLLSEITIKYGMSEATVVNWLRKHKKSAEEK